VGMGMISIPVQVCNDNHDNLASVYGAVLHDYWYCSGSPGLHDSHLLTNM